MIVKYIKLKRNKVLWSFYRSNRHLLLHGKGIMHKIKPCKMKKIGHVPADILISKSLWSIMGVAHNIQCNVQIPSAQNSKY